MISVNISISIEDDRVGDLLNCAIEGGSTYWAKRISRKASKTRKVYVSEVPMNGGSLAVETQEPQDQECVKYEVDRGRCQWALEEMATKYRNHFDDFINESEDAETGDLFLQLACLGEVTFG